MFQVVYFASKNGNMLPNANARIVVKSVSSEHGASLVVVEIAGGMLTGLSGEQYCSTWVKS